MSIGSVTAWGEDTPYSTTNAWITDVEYCESGFTVAVANFNHTYPNAFNYTLTYVLRYRDIDGNLQDESISVDTFNVTIGSGQYTLLSHTINVNTVMNIIEEIEEDTDDPYRVVKIELDYTYCDDGGCAIGSDESSYIDFTNCNPADGTSYGDALSETTGTDYGFDLEGRGSGGGSGSIYTGINMYGSGEGDTTGMGAGFNTIFWCIIPLIFILSVMKLASRVLK
jgi:hypothetical protein